MRVLVAVDLHDRAADVAREAGIWADRIDATVDLLYVAPWAASTMYIEEPAVRAVMDGQYQQVRQSTVNTLNNLLGTLPPARQGEAHVVDGTPGRVITDMADRYDVVVVGTHGRTGLEHLFLGSVAERVVRTVNVPVLVLRVPEEAT